MTSRHRWSSNWLLQSSRAALKPAHWATVAEKAAPAAAACDIAHAISSKEGNEGNGDVAESASEACMDLAQLSLVMPSHLCFQTPLSSMAWPAYILDWKGRQAQQPWPQSTRASGTLLAPGPQVPIASAETAQERQPTSWGEGRASGRTKSRTERPRTGQQPTSGRDGQQRNMYKRARRAGSGREHPPSCARRSAPPDGGSGAPQRSQSPPSPQP